MALPGFLGTPESIVAGQHQITLGLPRHVFVRAGADRRLARIEGFVSAFLGQARSGLGRHDKQAYEVVGQRRGRAVGDDLQGVGVDDFGFFHAAHVDRGRVGARDERNTFNRELHIGRREVGAIVELDATAQFELPGRVVDGLPALRQAGLQLQAITRPDQRVEHMFQRLGVGAGGSEMRVYRIGSTPDTNGESLGRQRACQYGSTHQAHDKRAHIRSPENLAPAQVRAPCGSEFNADLQAQSIPFGTNFFMLFRQNNKYDSFWNQLGASYKKIMLK